MIDYKLSERLQKKMLADFREALAKCPDHYLQELARAAATSDRPYGLLGPLAHITKAVALVTQAAFYWEKADGDVD